MKKESLNLVLLSFIFVSSLMFISAASFLDNSVPTSITLVTQFLQLGEVWKDFIIGLIILVIMIAALYDILELTSIFDSQVVKLLISIGLGLIFAITGLVNKVTIGMVSFAAGFGAFAIWVEIVFALAMFIGLAIGNSFIAKWAAKRKGQKEHIKAITGSDQASAAIEGLRNIQKEFRKKE